MLAGYPVQPNKSVVGAQRVLPRVRHPPARRADGAHDVRDHEPRGHRPGSATTIVLGKHSGRHAFVDALDAARPTTSTTPDLSARSPASRSWPTARRRHRQRPRRAGHRGGRRRPARRRRAGRSTGSRSPAAPTPRRRRPSGCRRGDESSRRRATGDGMIDAACNAVAKATGVDARLLSFQVAAVDAGHRRRRRRVGRRRGQRPAGRRARRLDRRRRGQRPRVPARGQQGRRRHRRAPPDGQAVSRDPLAVIAGDGIGPEVVAEGLKVLDAAVGRTTSRSRRPTTTSARAAGTRPGRPCRHRRSRSCAATTRSCSARSATRPCRRACSSAGCCSSCGSRSTTTSTCGR